MYRVGHNVLKLDGVITEFADIYAPLAQIWKNERLSTESLFYQRTKKNIKSNLQIENDE
jgi:hypothetical protein